MLDIARVQDWNIEEPQKEQETSSNYNHKEPLAVISLGHTSWDTGGDTYESVGGLFSLAKSNDSQYSIYIYIW